MIKRMFYTEAFPFAVGDDRPAVCWVDGDDVCNPMPLPEVNALIRMFIMAAALGYSNPVEPQP